MSRAQQAALEPEADGGPDGTRAAPASFPRSPERALWRRPVDRWRRWRAQRSLLAFEPGAPTLAAPRSQAVTRQQCREASYARWCAVIREEPRLHRKQWEYAYVLGVLEDAGLLGPGKRGLGFGVGREPLVAAIAAAGCTVVATDQPPDGAAAEAWRATGEYGGGAAALNARGICPERDFRERVTFAHCDMRRLDGLTGPFDFLWSSCALEHLGALADGLEFVERSLALLRPGGIAVHTTEYNASSNEATVTSGPVVLYRRRDLEGLRRRLRAAGHALELEFDTGDTPEDRHVDVVPFREDLHLKVLYGRFATTSFGLRIARGGA